MLTPLQQSLLKLVREHGQVEGQIILDGVTDEDGIAAAYGLVKAGLLVGKFPPNANRRDGIDWGYLIDPNKNRT